MTQVVAPRVTRQTVGAIADGAFKVVLAAVCIAGAAPLGRLLGTPAWLMVVWRSCCLALTGTGAPSNPSISF